MSFAPRIARNVPKGKRPPNLRRKASHLAFIRSLPCLRCGLHAPSQPAHVRIGTDGGTGIKSSDKYTVPLCINCHYRQHGIGEITFWAELQIDPLDAASALWTHSGDIEAGERIMFRARQRINLVR